MALCAIPLYRTPKGTSKFRAYRFTLSQTLLALTGWLAFIIAVVIWIPMMIMSTGAWLEPPSRQGPQPHTTMVLVFAIPLSLFCMGFAAAAFSFIEEVEENKQRRQQKSLE